MITNETGNATRRVDLVFGIGYNDDMQAVKTVLAEVVSQHPLILKDPAPNIRVHEFADSSVNVIVRPWVNTEDYYTVYWDLMQTVKERFDAAGISMPFPQRELHLYQHDIAS